MPASRHESLEPALWAAQACEAMAEEAAVEIPAKLALDEARVAVAIRHGGLLQERLQVIAYDSVQHPLLGLSAAVPARKGGNRCSPATLEGDCRQRGRASWRRFNASRGTLDRVGWYLGQRSARSSRNLLRCDSHRRGERGASAYADPLSSRREGVTTRSGECYAGSPSGLDSGFMCLGPSRYCRECHGTESHPSACWPTRSHSRICRSATSTASSQGADRPSSLERAILDSPRLS